MALVALTAAMLLPVTTVYGAAAAAADEGPRALAIEMGTPFRDHARGQGSARSRVRFFSPAPSSAQFIIEMPPGP